MGNSRECRFIPSGANHPTVLSRFRPTLPLILAVVTVFGLRSTAPLYSAEPAAARVPETITLWPKDHMPGRASAGPERESPSRGDNVIRLTDVIEPSIALFKVPNAPQPTPAVIICPGGGYNILAYDKEGTEIAAWLNTIGITGIVLKYRVPNNQDGAFQDLQRAMPTRETPCRRLENRAESHWGFGILGRRSSLRAAEHRRGTIDLFQT